MPNESLELRGRLFYNLQSVPNAWRFGFLAKKILGFLTFFAEIIGNYSWQGAQDFARFFEIVERNPRKFLKFSAKNLPNPRSWQEVQNIPDYLESWQENQGAKH